ncbi:hypothetical protein, partial [Aeromonas dhakensis]|uniref:hypothetical protein n=1 Tax=Aeromonas dhakensis TaxID=196024 RepID=UPI003987249E
IDWIGHTEYSETRIEQLDHIFNLIGISDKPIQPHTEPLNLRMAGLPQAGTVNEVRNGDAIHQVGNRRGSGII